MKEKLVESYLMIVGGGPGGANEHAKANARNCSEFQLDQISFMPMRLTSSIPTLDVLIAVILTDVFWNEFSTHGQS